MVFSPKPTNANPGTCLITQRGTDADGFIDPQVTLGGWDTQPLISIEGLRILNRFAGWPTKDEADAKDAEIARLTERLNEVEDELNQAETVLQAIDVIESHDHFRRARQKPGRRKKTEPQSEPTPA